MILPPNSKLDQVVAICAKSVACVLFSVAAVGLIYFAFDGLADRLKASMVAATLSVLFLLAFSGLMLLFLYGVVKTSVYDYAIQIRLLRGHGFSKVKRMTAEEFDRLSVMERLIDEEVLERTKQRARKRSHDA